MDSDYEKAVEPLEKAYMIDDFSKAIQAFQKIEVLIELWIIKLI